MHTLERMTFKLSFTFFLISYWFFSILDVIKIHTKNLYFKKDILNCLLRTLPSSSLVEALEGHNLLLKWNYKMFPLSLLLDSFSAQLLYPSQVCQTKIFCWQSVNLYLLCLWKQNDYILMCLKVGNRAPLEVRN